MKTVVPTPAPARRLANLALIPTAVFTAFGLLGLANGAPVAGILFLLFVPGYLMLGYRLRHVGIDATESGLVVHNPFRDSEIAFADIFKVGVDIMPGAAKRTALFIRAREDSDIVAWCTQAGRRSVIAGMVMMTESQQSDALSRVRDAVAAAAAPS